MIVELRKSFCFTVVHNKKLLMVVLAFFCAFVQFVLYAML